MMEMLQHIPVQVNQPPVIPEFFNLKTDDIPDLPPLISNDFSPQSDAGLIVSEEEYWKNYYEHPDFRYEWNNGILEVKAVGDYASYLQSEFFSSILKEHIKTTQIAKLVGLDIGFKLVLPDKKSIRKPDIAVILNTNPVQIEPDHCTYKGCFDMCIEFLSDSDKRVVENDTVVKKLEYSQGGVKEYYILDRYKKETSFYRLKSNGIYEKIKPQKGIIKSRVLPGFRFRIKDLYDQPTLEDLIKDKVYQPYVLKSYQEQFQRAEKERLRAEKEQQKAEKERQKAEKAINAERLRAEKAIDVEKRRVEKAIDAERLRAEKAIDAEKLRAEKAEQEVKKLAAKLQRLLAEKEILA